MEKEATALQEDKSEGWLRRGSFGGPGGIAIEKGREGAERGERETVSSKRKEKVVESYLRKRRDTPSI